MVHIQLVLYLNVFFHFHILDPHDADVRYRCVSRMVGLHIGKGIQELSLLCQSGCVHLPWVRSRTDKHWVVQHAFFQYRQLQIR